MNGRRQNSWSQTATNMQDLIIRDLEESDCQIIENAFAAQGWGKKASKYQKILAQQEKGERDFLFAALDGVFAGYVTICWKANYLPFREKGIPEIVDFNVLKKFQRKGIGTALMDEAEKRISKVSKIAGIGFGLTKDYGPAQILYIKRGYIPDGNGIVMDSKPLAYETQVTVGDDLVFCLIKEL